MFLRSVFGTFDRRLVGVEPVGGGGNGNKDVESCPCVCGGGNNDDVEGLGNGSKPVLLLLAEETGER